MLNCIFLVPIDHRGVQGKLINRYLDLQSWCNKNNSAILTTNGLFLNFARNYLATGGKGFVDTSPPDAEWLFWIDSDVDFTIQQVEYMMTKQWLVIGMKITLEKIITCRLPLWNGLIKSQRKTPTS